MTYRLPAEWENHNMVLLMFPCDDLEFPGLLPQVQAAMLQYIKVLSLDTNVKIFVEKNFHNRLSNRLFEIGASMSNISLDDFKLYRAWLRDNGPITVFDTDNQPVLLDFKFNAWAIHHPYPEDDALPEYVGRSFNINTICPMHNGRRVVLEGGSIDTNGCGTIITTEQCLMSQDEQVRNFGFTKKDYQDIFAENFGCKNTIWLGNGLEGDDTHGHVDDICRFVDNQTVLAAYENDTTDVNYQALNDNYNRLKLATLENGNKLNVIKLPMPSAVEHEGIRLPASYANFLITPKSVCVPVFNDANDAVALDIIAKCFPTRVVKPIFCGDIVWGRGGLHCLSHEIYLKN